MDSVFQHDRLCKTYNLNGPISCELIRSYTNDVYLVAAKDERYVFKIYGVNWRTEPEVRYEIDLLNHLFAGGAQTGRAVMARDGEALRTVSTDHGQRFAVLYAFLPGEKPAPPFTWELYTAFGRSVAQMHSLSCDFVSHHKRTPLDLSYVLDGPLEIVIPLLSSKPERTYLLNLASRVRSGLEALRLNSLDWGPIHGDATLDNVHRTTDGQVLLYDFDSGGPGWRAADLQGWAACCEEYRERWVAFREGYSQIRPLSEVDVLAAPYLTVAWDIWGLQIDLERRVLKQGELVVAEYLQDQIVALHNRERILAVDS